MTTTYKSAFGIGDSVLIDDDSSITAIVTGVAWRAGGYAEIEVQWFHEGEMKTAWLGEYRLTFVQRLIKPSASGS